MELRYKINARVLVFAMIGATMVFASYLTFVYNPVQLIIEKCLSLEAGTPFFKLWSNPPHEILIKVFIFNVTNHQEFQEGKEKLKFKEIGPYVYREQLKNTNVTFNANGTVTFYPRRFLDFKREYSVGDPSVDRIISPNIPLLGITASLQEASMITNLGVASISNFLDSQAFLDITIEQYLWGYDDRLVVLANQAIPSWINFEKFGILDRLMAMDNASNVVTITRDASQGMSQNPVLTEEERAAPYHINTFNGSPGLAHWGYTQVEGNETVETNTKCNTLEGSYEGTIFPMNLKVGGGYRLYRRAFCRPVPSVFDGVGYTQDGIRAYHYKVDKLFLATPEENPDNACYCPKSGCLKKGLGSLAPCYYDIPIAISQPHFLNSDPWLLEQVNGMNPDEKTHGAEFFLHPQMGIPLDSHLRIQINLDVGQTKYNSRTEPFNGLVLPLFWLELALDRIPTFVIFVMKLLDVIPIVQIVVMYLLGIIGLALISFSAVYALFFTDRERRESLIGPSYSPIPLIPMASQYFKPDIRISK